MEYEARLRGLHRVIFSKTISPRLWNTKPACAGYGGIITQRPLVPRSRGANDAPNAAFSTDFSLRRCGEMTVWQHCVLMHEKEFSRFMRGATV
jgi:hypothetical protein